MAKCNCRLCCQGRIIDAGLALKNFAVLERIIRSLQNELCCQGEEYDVLRCVMDGTWPSSMQRLAKAMSKAFKVNQEELQRR